MYNLKESMDMISKSMSVIQHHAAMTLASTDANSSEFRLALSAIQMTTSFANTVESEKHYAKQKETMQEMNDIFTLKVGR